MSKTHHKHRDSSSDSSSSSERHRGATKKISKDVNFHPLN